MAFKQVTNNHLLPYLCALLIYLGLANSAVAQISIPLPVKPTITHSQQISKQVELKHQNRKLPTASHSIRLGNLANVHPTEKSQGMRNSFPRVSLAGQRQEFGIHATSTSGLTRGNLRRVFGQSVTATARRTASSSSSGSATTNRISPSVVTNSSASGSSATAASFSGSTNSSSRSNSSQSRYLSDLDRLK